MSTYTMNSADVVKYGISIQQLGQLFKAAVCIRDVKRAIKILRDICIPYIAVVSLNNSNAARIEVYVVELPSGKFVLASTSATATTGATVAKGCIHGSAVFTKFTTGRHVRAAITGWRMTPHFPKPTATFANLRKTGLKW